MNPLFVKPSNVRYVDMCIWIDNNFYKPNCDVNKAFSYMYLLAYMLASKAKYFSKAEDYDGFAFYLAKSTFQRMTDDSKVKIKSVLNYMKSIMYFRRVSYLRETFSEVIDPVYNEGWDGDAYREKTISIIEGTTNDLLRSTVVDYIQSFPQIIKSCIPESYKTNDFIFNNLYISALLSFIYSITLDISDQEKLETRSNHRSNFDSAEYRHKKLEEKIILWNLPENLEDVVRVTMNKAKKQFVSDICEIKGDFSLDEKCYNDLFKEEIFKDDSYGSQA